MGQRQMTHRLFLLSFQVGNLAKQKMNFSHNVKRVHNFGTLERLAEVYLGSGDLSELNQHLSHLKPIVALGEWLDNVGSSLEIQIT
jgi:hypothetical protein